MRAAQAAAAGATVGWRARADEISMLCKEQREPQEESADDAVTPEDVFRHKKKQEILCGEGPRREAQAEAKFAQVFKKLELKDVPRVQRPRAGGGGPRGGDRVSDDDDDEPAPHTTDPHANRSQRLKAAMGQRTARRSRETEKPFEIVIPLGNDRIKTRDIHKDKALRSEYAARYLERLGVSPTPANLALIWKEIPLEDCRIQQVFHPGLSKHEKRNYIVIRPNQKHRRHRGGGPGGLHDPQHIPFETLPDTLLEPAEDEARSRRRPDVQTVGSAEQDEDQRGARLRPFTEYKESFLYPFNLKARYGSGAGGKEARQRQERRGQRRGLPPPPKAGPSGGTASDTSDADSSSSEESASAAIARLGSDRAMTEQRLRLQDRMIALAKSQAGPEEEQPAKSDTVAEGDRSDPQTPEAEPELREQEDTASQRLRLELERKAAEGDLSALEAHPDMDQADCIPLHDAAHRIRPSLQRPAAPAHQQHDGAMSAAAKAAAVEQGKENDAIRKEIGEGPPRVGDGQIRELFSKFVAEFPFRRFWGARGVERPQSGRPDSGEDGPAKRLDEELRQRCGKELTQGLCINFEIMLLNFLYWTFLAPLSSAQAARREALNPDAAFADVYQQMLTLLSKRTARKHFAVDLPLTLLAVRVVTEAVFSNCYPKWAGSTDGVTSLRRIDSLITQLLDPMGYLSHVSVVESSPQALRVLHRKRAPQRMPLTFTSPMIRFVVGEARSKEAKALLAGSSRDGGNELFSLLTPTIRAKLLNIIATYKMKVRPRSAGASRVPSPAVVIGGREAASPAPPAPPPGLPTGRTGK
eukprot:TRINITY_DN29980_c0_g1_i1.p1 TRINITY_DN29980_c0_g1~~TRINITY_DN29980_c0_g1_i1.p1  ORF type:complete len:811 (+),score=299.61 TRINITY_DN29980_c0_g1_i1:51-2483(+)